MTTLFPELWPWLAGHSRGAGFNETYVLWTLRDLCKLCGSAVCHVPVIIQQCRFLNFFVPQSNKLMLLTDRLILFDVESIDLLRSKSISLTINRFSVFKILVLAYHHVSRWKGIESVSCFLYLGFYTEGFVLILGKLEDLSWRLFSTSTNGTIYSALMGSILTEAPGLGSGTGLYP